MAADLAVNSEARLWGPFKELERIINAAVYRKNPDAVLDLEVGLKQHKPHFISLLKNPPKNTLCRDAVKKSTTVGLPVQGEQTSQTFSSQFIEEALILSDLFTMNEVAAVELLTEGERKKAEFPGLTRGLVAVLLYYDGQRSLVSGLRTLVQSRKGRTWTMELSPDLANLVTQFTDQLIQKDGLVNKVLDLLNRRDSKTELDRLQRDRALGSPKHTRQVRDIYTEINLILADCLFCLSSQQPLDKTSTLRLIDHLRGANSVSGEGPLDLVNLCLLMALLYCFDVSVLEQEDAEESVKNLPLMNDASYVGEIHQALTGGQQWTNMGLRGIAQFAWGLTLRQLSQYHTPAGVNKICEEDESLITMALDNNVFHYMIRSVVAVSDFHSEEFYMRKIHGLLTDFIFHMPLKVKELRNRSDEAARILMSQTQDGLDTTISPNRGFEYLLQLIGDLYNKDPQGLDLCLEYWCPQEAPTLHESMYHYRPPQRQVALYKFVRLAGDLLPSFLYQPYINMLIGLCSNQQGAHHCFDLLKSNGMGSGGPASSVSWNHIFTSLNQYYTSLRREAPTSADSSHHQRAPHLRGITPAELDGLVTVLKLTRTIAEQNENCRIALCENQQWSAVMIMFGLVTCSIPSPLKAELFRTLAAFARSPDIAASLWQTLEVSQILPTIQSKGAGGIQVELDEIESRNEEYPMIQGFLALIDTLTDIPVPAGLGAGLRAPGFDPYLLFLRDSVFLRFNSRAYKNPGEKWEIAASVLNILSKLLREHEIVPEDFVDELIEVQSGGTVVANKSAGHTLLVYMLNDSSFLRMILRILDDVINQLETYTDIPGKALMERTALLCLRMIEYTLEKADQFVSACRETGASIMVVSMDRLLLGINPRTGKPDHLVNIAKYITFGTFLPYHAQAAMTVLYRVCRTAPIQTKLLNLFTADQKTSCNLDLLHGFVECLEVDEAEEVVQNRVVQLDEAAVEVNVLGNVRNSTRQNLLRIILHCLDQPSPNLAHLLLGFDLQKPVSKTNLQDQGILGSPKTCLHAILSILEQGVGSSVGPSCLHETPQLAELCYKLIFKLCSNKDTSAPTLRYLRTSRDFLYRQLHHLPYTAHSYAQPVASHQAWLLKTVAVELRMTSLNRQRSHTQRLMRLLLDDNQDDQSKGMNAGGVDDTDTLFDRFGDTSMYMSTYSQNKQLRGKQTRRKLLCLLDAVDFTQQYPTPMSLEFFEPAMIEKVIQSTETVGEHGVVCSNINQLHQILTNELNNVQGTVMAAQRHRIVEEVQGILRNVVARNEVRVNLKVKQQSFDAWRHVAEILLTSCPEDLLPRDARQAILFELLQDLLQKVGDEAALTELTSPVAGVVLTLMANLRQCFSVEQATSDGDRYTHYGSRLQENSATLGQSVAWAEGSGSRTLFATSLQLVLKGLIEHILRSSGGLQRMRANLYGSLLYYLQIAQKPKTPTNPEKDQEGVGGRILAASDSEYDQLAKENVSTILSYGDNFMETVCRDACDGHDVGRMLALSVMDTILSMDKFQQWLTFLSSKGYLQHLVDSLLHDDEQLQTLLSQNPELRILYIYESKMGLLTRIAESTTGAHTILRCGLMQRLAGCSFFDMRPELERSRDAQGFLESEEFIPSPMARYQHVLFASLKLCLALLTSLGIENQDAGNQVLQFIFAHGDVFHNILRDRQPSLNLSALRELALTTAVIARANYRGIPDAEFDDIETAGIEFRGHKTRIERQMLALVPKYCLSEKLTKQLRNLESQQLQEGRDLKAEVTLAYQEVAANVTSFCRAVISTSGYSSQFCRVIFGPSLEEALARDIRNTEEFSLSSMTPAHIPNLGIIVYQLRQCAGRFMSVYDTHQQHLRKLQSLADLSTDDLKEFSGVPATEKMPSQQRQHLAHRRLAQIVHYKGGELKHLAYIIENCIFILWRHLEYYLLHCVPIDQQPTLYQSQVKRQQQMRRLQDLTGTGSMMYDTDVGATFSEGDELTRGVTREELATLKQTAVSAITESLLKKLSEINQSFCKNRSHYGFVEALIRRTKRLLRLHTGS
ncbi:nuclear pore complex protein Nup205-like [Mizuhopecten yessoensis]|uniref:Nucleoporin 205 n=1 Tax=Mizuhopecten yessoensis TaxID=6573 RepID=A0A210R3N4_MIZYE|nr:nuclear pore complex protein Nup205-like [Mizuhopecten yessoensis]OWF55575.1 Nucleoporin 205 [Mizuhopecten yessoensis]